MRQGPFSCSVFSSSVSPFRDGQGKLLTCEEVLSVLNQPHPTVGDALLACQEQAKAAGLKLTGEFLDGVINLLSQKR